jgi:hypothetical protein
MRPEFDDDQSAIGSFRSPAYGEIRPPLYWIECARRGKPLEVITAGPL